jgi:DNA modification methylase
VIQESLIADVYPQVMPSAQLEVLPVSVIDIEAQGKREKEDHAATSSRQNYSPFPNEIVTLCYEFFLRDAVTVFDPFAGWGERAEGAKRFGKRYVGYDISKAAIDSAETKYGAANFLADSRSADIPVFDGMITCPPYWNLERYESEVGLDKCKTWEEFLSDLRLVFERCYAAANGGATFCVMVGEWRKDHKFYDLEWHTSRIFKDLGASIVDKLVVSRKRVSKIKIMLPQCKRLGYSVRVHESLLVFRKPKLKDAA